MRIAARLLGCIAVGLGLATGMGARAEEAPVPPETERGEPATINADKVTFDRSTHMARGEGHVVIRYQDAVLCADRARLDTVTKDAWAEGQVRLTRANQEWQSPAVYYNFSTHALKADEVRGFFDPVVMHGQGVQNVGTNAYRFAGGTATTCDYEQPHYRLEATHGEIWPGDRVVLYNVTVRIGNLPIFWWPILVIPLGEDQPPFGLEAGHSSDWGYFLLMSATWKLNQDAALTLHLDERTSRGLGTGADLKYRVGSAGNGLIRGYYLNDTDSTKGVPEGVTEDIPRNRYRAQWQLKQALTDTIDLTADINKLSDPRFLVDFFQSEYEREAEPATTVDVTKRGENYTLSALVRPQWNEFYAEVERLPEATWAVNRTELWSSPLYYEGATSAGYLNNHPGDTGDPVFQGDAVRFDTFHQLVSPQMLFDWLSVVPRAGVRYTYYSQSPDGASDQPELRRYVYDLGVESSFKLSRTWDGAQYRPWRIDGLRHILEPFADYQWVPKPNQGPDQLYQFDTLRTTTLANSNVISLTRYSPLDFPGYNLVDDIDRENTVRFGLRQKLQTRREGRPWDLIEWEGWTDWRADQPANQEFSDVFQKLWLRPVEWMGLDVDSRYDTNQDRWREVNTAARVFDGEKWRCEVGTRYLDGDSNLVSMDLAWRLNRHWVAEIYQRVDLRDGTWESQIYRLRQETHDWFFDYGVRRIGQRAPQKDETVVFMAVTLKAYPRLGLHFK